jgi:glycosyltransferase involved in cell wall biosynthesis
MTRLGTILIPAYNEAAVIARTLGALRKAHVHDFFRVVVIPNGCRDDTAARARAAMREAEVIETPVASKTHALNLGYRNAIEGRPVVCLDADLEVGLADLIALVQPLMRGTADAACGQMKVDLRGASWMVRSYYKAWMLNPYFARGKFGGLFALSAKGARMVFPLPRITADDEYIRRAFSGQQTAFVENCFFTARAPRTLGSLIKVRRRSLRGAKAVSSVRREEAPKGSVKAMLSKALPEPMMWPSMAVFIGVMAVVRVQLAFEKPTPKPVWERDATTREGSVQS